MAASRGGTALGTAISVGILGIAGIFTSIFGGSDADNDAVNVGGPDNNAAAPVNGEEPIAVPTPGPLYATLTDVVGALEAAVADEALDTETLATVFVEGQPIPATREEITLLCEILTDLAQADYFQGPQAEPYPTNRTGVRILVTEDDAGSLRIAVPNED